MEQLSKWEKIERFDAIGTPTMTKRSQKGNDDDDDDTLFVTTE